MNTQPGSRSVFWHRLQLRLCFVEPVESRLDGNNQEQRFLLSVRVGHEPFLPLTDPVFSSSAVNDGDRFDFGCAVRNSNHRDEYRAPARSIEKSTYKRSRNMTQTTSAKPPVVDQQTWRTALDELRDARRQPPGS